MKRTTTTLAFLLALSALAWIGCDYDWVKNTTTEPSSIQLGINTAGILPGELHVTDTTVVIGGQVEKGGVQFDLLTGGVVIGTKFTDHLGTVIFDGLTCGDPYRIDQQVTAEGRSDPYRAEWTVRAADVCGG